MQGFPLGPCLFLGKNLSPIRKVKEKGKVFMEKSELFSFKCYFTSSGAKKKNPCRRKPKENQLGQETSSERGRI